MSSGDVPALVAARLRQADMTLHDARTILASGASARSAVNRAYYAAYYAGLALLQTTGTNPRKHQGVLTFVDRDFVRSGHLPKTAGDALHELFEARLDDDYRRIDDVSTEEAMRAIDLAEHFITAARAYLQTIGFGSPGGAP